MFLSFYFEINLFVLIFIHQRIHKSVIVVSPGQNFPNQKFYNNIFGFVAAQITHFSKLIDSNAIVFSEKKQKQLLVIAVFPFAFFLHIFFVHPTFVYGIAYRNGIVSLAGIGFPLLFFILGFVYTIAYRYYNLQ